MSEFWFGADPGGNNSFGLAFLGPLGVLRCASVSSVDDAVKRVHDEGTPLGIGIDAPMWWSSRRGAGRMADERLRKRYHISSGTVQSANSLRGAALIGGAMLAVRVREKFPGAKITESHPKALLKVLRLDEADFSKEFGVPEAWNNEHERDAAIAAVCAREGFDGRWTTDLAEHRHPSEQDPQSYGLAPMYYFWPKSP